jgi:predicted nucleic acid-binding protein
MILVDSSIWIDHLRSASDLLNAKLENREAMGHPMVLGEVLLGAIKDRKGFKTEYLDLPPADLASHDEVMHLVEVHKLHGIGIGYVDAHLLGSAYLSDAKILTRDKRLAGAAQYLGLLYQE